MNNKIYAGIGARKTPETIKTTMRILGMILAIKGYTLNTGLAIGADQAFIEGAVIGGGDINLYLPWASYESKWKNSLISSTDKSRINVIVFDKDKDIEAVKSVKRLHPYENKLKSSVIALHARNYLILKPADFAICWTPGGKVVGGTGQGIRIMKEIERNVFNLGKTPVLQKLCEVLRL